MSNVKGNPPHTCLACANNEKSYHFTVRDETVRVGDFQNSKNSTSYVNSRKIGSNTNYQGFESYSRPLESSNHHHQGIKQSFQNLKGNGNHSSIQVLKIDPETLSRPNNYHSIKITPSDRPITNYTQSSHFISKTKANEPRILKQEEISTFRMNPQSSSSFQNTVKYDSFARTPSTGTYSYSGARSNSSYKTIPKQVSSHQISSHHVSNYSSPQYVP
jgi:hypothetical protein